MSQRSRSPNGPRLHGAQWNQGGIGSTDQSELLRMPFSHDPCCPASGFYPWFFGPPESPGTETEDGPWTMVRTLAGGQSLSHHFLPTTWDWAATFSGIGAPPPAVPAPESLKPEVRRKPTPPYPDKSTLIVSLLGYPSTHADFERRPDSPIPAPCPDPPRAIQMRSGKSKTPVTAASPNPVEPSHAQKGRRGS